MNLLLFEGGFANETAALVVDGPPGGVGAVAVVEADGALEDVSVLPIILEDGVVGGGVGGRDFEEGAEFGEEELVVGTLGAAGVGSARNDMVDGFAFHAES